MRFGILPGVGRLDPALLPPPQVTGFYTIDSLLAGQWSVFGNALWHLVLPALVLAAPVTSLITRSSRAAVLDVIGNDYVSAARAKGLPAHVVIVRHVLRAALPSIITVAGLALADVLTGTVLVEQIFSWPGIGQYAYNSAINLDLPSIMGVTIFVAIVYTLTNLVVDVLYTVIDPRVPARMTALTSPGLTRQVSARGPPPARAQALAHGAHDRGRRHHRLLAARRAPGTAHLARQPARAERGPLLPPSARHLFGTDENGRDVLSRVLYGARVSLPLGVILVLLQLVIGGILGAVAGFFGGWVDQAIMRFTDLVFAFPTILLAMVVVAAMGPGIFHALIAVAAVGWPTQARVMRSLVRTTMQSDYVAVSRLLGASSARALRVEVVRNVLGPVVVLATLGVGNAILLLSGLSFLGLGARPPMAEWGSMIASGSQNFQDCVAGHLRRPGHLDRGDGLQLHRRRAARRAGPPVGHRRGARPGRPAAGEAA